MQSHQSSALAHFLARTREYKAECATLLRTIQEQQNAAAGQQHHHQNAVAANLPRQSAVAELKLSDLSAAECISTTTTTTPTSASIIAGYKDVAGVEHEVEDDDDENATLDGTEAEVFHLRISEKKLKNFWTVQDRLDKAKKISFI